MKSTLNVLEEARDYVELMIESVASEDDGEQALLTRINAAINDETEFFSVLRLAKEDIVKAMGGDEELGDGLTPEDIGHIAEELGDALMEGFWDMLALVTETYLEEEEATLLVQREPPTPIRYFLTVEWCSNGQCGIFCDSDGVGFPSDSQPHSQLAMQEILGPFWLILGPKSELLTGEELAEFSFFRPLAEYRNEYGIALKKCDVPIREATQ